jgi:hypothetical protein
MFELRMNEPQNFAAYRQAELDNQRATLFSSLSQTPYLSKRFMLKRFLGISEEELQENDKLWAEENGTTTAQQTVGEDLRSVGVTPGGLGTDIDAGAEPEGGDVDIDAPEGGDTSDDVEL